MSFDGQATFEIVYGQSVHDASVPDVEVRLGSSDGKQLRVQNDTYFRVTNVEDLVATDFDRFVCKCPAGLFTRIEKMLAARATAGHAASGTNPPAVVNADPKDE
jgi:hypothetical protein